MSNGDHNYLLLSFSFKFAMLKKRLDGIHCKKNGINRHVEKG